MSEKFKPNHLHFICKGYCTNPPKSVEELNSWLSRLVERVRMKVVAGPTSVYVSEPGNEGVTGTVTLATSHGSIHVWDNDEPPMFQFDIYSCTEFSPSEVIEHLKEFGLIRLEFMTLDRNEGIIVTEKRKMVF
jgi:S-adenosylmethionine/arginine decarboxylase-like enzyme